MGFLAEVAPIVTADTFAPVVTQVSLIVPLALAAGMGIYALIRGAKLVPKAIGWFIK